jgi:hypothetical protein
MPSGRLFSFDRKAINLLHGPLLAFTGRPSIGPFSRLTGLASRREFWHHTPPFLLPDLRCQFAALFRRRPLLRRRSRLRMWAHCFREFKILSGKD